jgi:hypothetical protein
MSRVLILAHQPAVPGHIRIQDGGKLPRQTVFHAAMPFYELGAFGKYYRGSLWVASECLQLRLLWTFKSFICTYPVCPDLAVSRRLG